ncbi:hypothetical protein RUM43_011302 [Polyplax serrata]|uniref:Uncharacterized protein n=1 Tax=Polyplax serrata TaxID=468196 RepID=A0AAN8NSU2_POLSC
MRNCFGVRHRHGTRHNEPETCENNNGGWRMALGPGQEQDRMRTPNIKMANPIPRSHLVKNLKFAGGKPFVRRQKTASVQPWRKP